VGVLTRIDRSFQTGARAEPVRPEDGTAGGAVAGRRGWTTTKAIRSVRGAAQELLRFVEEVYEDN
jgi:hypothetical protein